MKKYLFIILLFTGVTKAQDDDRVYDVIIVGAGISGLSAADYLINMTNVKGLYSADPKKVKNAKFISEISFKEFMNKVNKIKFKAGQHFVLDQSAAKIINKYKIKTVILKGIDNLEKALKDKKFSGTTIS